GRISWLAGAAAHASGQGARQLSGAVLTAAESQRRDQDLLRGRRARLTAMRSLIAPIRIRSAEHGRKVTWLELFFDLVFVAAVSQVAAPLHDDYTLHGLLRLTPLFVLIWCAWTGHSVFATRFDTDDAVQRGLTLLQMFAVTIMAANARDALDSRSSAGFAAAYGVMRLILVAQYARARSVPTARGLATRYLAGHGCAALMWLASAL